METLYSNDGDVTGYTWTDGYVITRYDTNWQVQEITLITALMTPVVENDVVTAYAYVDAYGSTMTYYVDANEVVTSYTSSYSGEGYSSTTSYDSLGNFNGYIYSDGIKTTEYDANWNVVSEDMSWDFSGMTALYDDQIVIGYTTTDEWGTTKTYFVDAAGELTGYTSSSSYTDSWSGNTYTYTYSYDAAGAFTGYSYSDGTTTTLYDANWTMLSSTVDTSGMDPMYAADGTTVIGYSDSDDWGNTTTYDLSGMVSGHISTSSYTDSWSGTTYTYTYTYDANWTMLSYSSSDGITTTTYDSNWQVVSTSVDYSALAPVYAADGITVAGYSYTDEWGTTKTYFVDAAGELTGFTSSSSYVDSWSGTTYTYTDSYDAAGMFTGYSYSDGTTTTVYDANGNMLSSTVNQDIIAPEPLDAILTTNGVTAFFGEDVILPNSDVALTLHQNGVTEMHITGITGDGTSTLDIATDVTLAAEDWVLLNYSATDSSNGISDTSGNVWLETDDFGYGGFVLGSEVSNTIDLSNSSIFSAVGGYDIVGRDGNDTIIGSAANDWIVGGMGADTMSGGSGADSFIFAPGESPALILDGGAGSYVDGAIVSFAGGSADIITDFGNGDTIEGFLANDQSLTIVSGSYNSQTGTFTVDRESGSDTMVISDTSDTGNTVETGVVMMGVTESQLYSSSWVGYDSTNYAVSYYAVA